MWNRLGFRDRLLMVGFSMMVLMLLALGGGASTLVDRHLRGELQARVQQLTPLFNAALGAPMAQRDYASVASIIEEIRGTRDLVYVDVLDVAGRTVTSPGSPHQSARPARQDADTLPFAAAIALGGQALGRVEFGLSRRAIEETRQSLLTGIALLSAAALAVFSLVLAVLSVAVTRPLKTLITAARDIQAGNYEVDLQSPRQDEFGLLMKTFGKMTQEVRRKVTELVTSENLQRRYLQESVQRQRETTAALQEAQAANRAKSDFIANMSHEIRTPMNSIIGYADLLGRTGLGPQQKAYVGRLQESSTALLGLINDILDFSKIEAGHLESSTENFELLQLIDTVCGLFTPAVRDKGLLLHRDIGPEVPAHLTGDRMRLQQVLVNLLGNAVKFTSKGRIDVEIRQVPGPDRARSTDRPPLTLRIAVRDTGIGIAHDQLEQVFQPFAQADGSITRRFGGTGLGLSISRSLADLMGGRLEVRSELGVGSEFAVYFPCVAVATASSPDPTALDGCALALTPIPAKVPSSRPGTLADQGTPDVHPDHLADLPNQADRSNRAPTWSSAVDVVAPAPPPPTLPPHLVAPLRELDSALAGKMMRARQLAETVAADLQGTDLAQAFTAVLDDTRRLRFAQAREGLAVFTRGLASLDGESGP